MAPAIATPARSGHARSRGSVTNPYLAARCQAGAVRSPEQHESVHAGGTSSVADPDRPNNSTSTPPKTPLTNAAIGRKMAKTGPKSA